MTIPVLYTLARSNPKDTFTLLTRASMTKLVVNPPENVHVVGVDLPGNPFGDLRALREALSRCAEIAPVGMVVDLHDVLRTRLLRLLAFTRRIPFSRFDKARHAKRELLVAAAATECVHGVLPLPKVRSTVKRYRDAFPHHLLRHERFRSVFAGTPTGKGDPAAFASLTPPKASGERWIGIAPFAKHAGKIYPRENMLEVVDGLSAEEGVKIFLFGGGPEETAILDEWASRGKNIVNVAGASLGFAGELSLMSHLDRILTMDSANMHMAALAGTPTTSIWGATSPEAGFAPFNSRSTDFIQLPLSCRPCSIFGNRPCRFGTMECMTSLPPSMVTRTLLDSLRPKDSKPQAATPSEKILKSTYVGQQN